MISSQFQTTTNKLSREWAIVFIAAFVFFLGSESYKYMKRVFFRRVDAKKGKEDYSQDVEDRVFQRYKRRPNEADAFLVEALAMQEQALTT